MDPTTTLVVVTLGAVGVYLYYKANYDGSINKQFKHYGGYKSSRFISQVSANPSKYDATYYDGPRE